MTFYPRPALFTASAVRRNQELQTLYTAYAGGWEKLPKSTGISAASWPHPGRHNNRCWGHMHLRIGAGLRQASRCSRGFGPLGESPSAGRNVAVRVSGAGSDNVTFTIGLTNANCNHRQRIRVARRDITDAQRAALQIHRRKRV